MPPLEYAGEFYFINEEGAAILSHAYQPHYCDPDKVEAYQEQLRRIAKAKGIEYDEEQNAWEAAKEMRREEQWAVALKVPCRRCEEPAGKKCHRLDLRFRKTGELVETLNPHPERVEDAERS